MDRLWKDLQYAARTLLKKPGFTLVVLLTLALGIGANTAIFSVVSAVIFRPLPFREPERLVNIWEGGAGTVYRRGEESRFIFVRPGTFHDWREQSQSFQNMAAYSWRAMLLTGGDKAEMLWANHVTEGFFETLGAPAKLGRTFSADDYGPGAERAVILSHKLWRSRFGADAAIVGRAISLNDQAHIVVGVMPEGFYPTRFNAPDLWTPRWFGAGEKYDRVSWGLTTFARLKPGVAIDQANSEMQVVAKAIETAHPENYQNMGAVLVPADAELIGSHGKLFLFLLGAGSLVLLVACVNVANLLLARATDREREFSVRASLGASRGRIVSQLLTESLLLSGTGTSLGLLLAHWAIHPVVALLPDASRIPRLDAVKLDLTVLGFTLLVAVVTGTLFGLAPALRASRVDLNEALKEAGRGNTVTARKRRLGELLVISEVASSLVLLIGAGLLVQSFQRMQRVDSGFKPANLLTLKIEAPEHRYGKYETGGKNAPRARLYEELERRIAALPGVESVAGAGKLPMKHSPNPWAVSVEGRGAPPRNPEEGMAALSNKTGLYNHGSTSDQRVSPAYFRTLGMRLTRGRLLDESDRPGAPMTAVVNEAFVRKFFPDEDPVGKRMVVDYTSWFPKITIVGVVADARLNGLDRKPFAEMFWPMAQAPSQSVWLIVRTAGDPLALASAVQREVRAVDRDLPIEEVSPMETVIADSLWQPRFSAVLIGLFAGLALTLAAAGIYGVMSYQVSRRAYEMGLRIALGANARAILGLVIGRGLRLTAIGILIGLAVSLSLSKLVASHLYGVNASDPLTMVVLSLFLMLVAALACFIPAWRAAQVDPMIALRYE
jgi:putative ABC transport system permease protein